MRNNKLSKNKRTKLNPQQLTALAGIIISNIQKKEKNFNKAIETSDDYAHFMELNPECIELNKIAHKYPETAYNVKNIMQVIRDETFKGVFKKVPNVDARAIENDIIIASIEQDVEVSQLIESLTNKYRK